MKSAEEIYIKNGCNHKRDIIESMKEYASIVAEQALIDAANNFDLECNQFVILKTEIKLP